MHRAGVPLIATIKVEDRLADEIHEKLRALKLLQFDRNYWERHSLSFLGAANLRKTVDIYPRTPFLADGEEMIWQSLTIETIDKERKVMKVDAITNFRIFQYDYNEHQGEGILIPCLDNNMTIDERPTLQINAVGTYFVASYNITGIKEAGTTKIIGDITFYVNDKPSITITQITDPDTLATAVRRLKDRHNITGIDVKEQYANITSSTVRSMICSNCHHNNPPDSNFCNKCGVSLRPLTVVCDKCGHSNSSGSIFCSTCGNK